MFRITHGINEIVLAWKTCPMIFILHVLAYNFAWLILHNGLEFLKLIVKGCYLLCYNPTIQKTNFLPKTVIKWSTIFASLHVSPQFSQTCVWGADPWNEINVTLPRCIYKNGRWTKILNHPLDTELKCFTIFWSSMVSVLVELPFRISSYHIKEQPITCYRMIGKTKIN